MKKLFLILILVLSLLTGCGGGAAEGGADMAPGESFDKYQSLNSMDMGFVETEDQLIVEESVVPDTNSTTRPYGDNVKLILRANLHLETTEFEAAVDQLNQLVSQYGGYYERSDVDMGSYYSDGWRCGYYTVRVPSENYDSFLNSVGDVCHVTNRTESAEDVGLQYYDIESQIRLLEIKQERLLKLLEQASTMEDIITLENALSDIQYHLEANNSQKNRYDSLINYSTVEIRLEQVQRLSGEPMEQQGFFSQLSTALTNGLLNTLDACSDLLLTLAYNIIPLSIFALIIFWLVSLRKKRRQLKPPKQKKSLFRKKGETVAEVDSEVNPIPDLSESEK